jgi:hypothetical protein
MKVLKIPFTPRIKLLENVYTANTSIRGNSLIIGNLKDHVWQEGRL